MLFVFGVLVLVVVLVTRSKLGKRVSDVEDRVEDVELITAAYQYGRLEKRLKSLEEQVRRIHPGAAATPVVELAESVAERSEPATDPPAPEVEGPLVPPSPSPAVHRPAPVAHPVSEPTVQRPSQLRERWERIEQQFVENWTGILGSIALVAGIAFLGGYTGLRLSPFYRSLMIVGAAGLLIAGSCFLGRREMWKPLSQWLRSSGAAVFLFACFASSAIPGLAWITTLVPALGVLLLGVSVNIYVAWTAGKQAFASLHVVLSLIPLALIPQSNPSLILATLVTAVGLTMAYRARWDLHSLITAAAFVVFHIAWYAAGSALTPDIGGRAIGVLSALLIGCMVVLTHYRRTYASSGIKTLPFLVHLTGWSMLVTAAIVYAGNTPLRGVTLVGAAVVVFFLARRGRTLGIRWVYLTDTLVAEAIALVGIVSFYPFVLNWLLVSAVIFLQTVLCLKIGIDEDEELFERVGIHLVHVAGAVLTISGLVAYLVGVARVIVWRVASAPDRAMQNQNALILLVSALVGAGIHLYLVKRRGEAFSSLPSRGLSDRDRPQRISLLGSGVGIITAVALINLTGGRWMGIAALASTTAFVLLARRWGSLGLGVAAWITLVSAHLFSWIYLFAKHPVPPVDQLLYYLVPLVLTGAAAIAYAAPAGVGRFLRHWAIHMLGFTVAAAAYTLLQPISSLVPGVIWLILSLVVLEVANRVQRDQITPVLCVGYAYLALFGGAYLLVVLQTQSYWGPVPIRGLIEGFALAVLGFWWLYRPTGRLAEQRSWRAVHPLFLEVVLIFLAVVTAVEVATQWRPVVWGVLAILAVTNPLGGTLDVRFRFYSVVFYWVSVYDLIVTSGFATPSPLWYEHPGFTGGLAIALQVSYLAYGSQRLALARLEFPPGLTALSAWSRAIASRQPLWLYYPFFAGTALFSYWRFDAVLLTLLWSAEAFVVFVLSLVLRENHFRYMALTGLAVCFARLLLFDMAQTSLGSRGLVFVGVGSLMLGMNSLYNRYKDRFA